MGMALPKISADYGAGFANSIIVRGLPLTVAHPGQTFWVDANAGHTGRGTFKNPDTTIDAAYNRTVTGRGDIVMVKPGHTEDVDAAGDITMDKDSVAVVGLGVGNDQAQVTFSAAAGDIDITGDNNALYNMRISCEVANQVHVLDVGGDHFLVHGCKFDITYEGTNYDCQKTITIAAGTTGFGLVNNLVDYTTNDSSYPASFVFAEGTGFGVWQFIGNKIIGPFSVANFDLDDDAMSAILFFEHNLAINTDTDPGTVCLVNAATVCINNRNCWGGTKAGTAPFGDDGASFQFEDLGTDVAGSYAVVFGTATAF